MKPSRSPTRNLTAGSSLARISGRKSLSSAYFSAGETKDDTRQNVPLKTVSERRNVRPCKRDIRPSDFSGAAYRDLSRGPDVTSLRGRETLREPRDSDPPPPGIGKHFSDKYTEMYCVFHFRVNKKKIPRL